MIWEQFSFIFSLSLRDMIIWQLEFLKNILVEYFQIDLLACPLGPDQEMLPGGDMKELGAPPGQGQPGDPDEQGQDGHLYQ